MPTPVRRSSRLWPALLALGLTVFGARLWLVHRYGSAMPFWDQWPGEGWVLLKPWHEGQLTWATMVSPSLEHRVFWTRVLTIGLFELNGGQWDGAVEMTVNAALVAGLLAGVALVAVRAGGGNRAMVLGGAAVLGALPYAWENTLLGFASQFYLLLGFSLLALRGLGTRPAGSAGWWAGALAAVAACFSMGSGLMAAVAAGGWVALNALRGGRRPTRGEWATLAVCAAVALLGIALRADVPGHAGMRAASAAAWARALGADLSWPMPLGLPWGALILYLPTAMLAAVWLRRPERGGAMGGALLVGGWVLLQAAAMAYARGGTGQSGPAARYLDLLAAGVAVNGVAAWRLVNLARPANALTAGPGRRVGRGLALAGAAGWTILLAVGLARQTVQDFQVNLPARRGILRSGEINVRAFLRGDRAVLLNKPLFAIPYPDGGDLGVFLSDPFIQSALPAVIRPPLALEPEGDAAAATAFTPDGMAPALQSKNPPAWGSGEPGRTGEFRARLNPAPRLPYLRWELAGDLGAAGTDLDLRVEDAAGSRAEDVRPLRAAGATRWRPEFAAVPAGAARVVATDHDAAHGFAFRAPVEVGPLSRWVEWLLRRGVWVFGAGVLGLLWEGGRRKAEGGNSQ